MTRFALSAIAPTPWKNGGGTTREIAAWPPGAMLDDFAWRISVADIVADGPFSAFAGIDRQIVLLAGAGVRLRADDGSFDQCLDTVGEPFSFPGDVTVDARLIGGATRDFNVMTRRGSSRGQVQTMRQRFTVNLAADAVLLFVVSGAWASSGEDKMTPLLTGEGEMLWPCTSPASRSLEPLDASSLCLCVTLKSEGTQ